METYTQTNQDEACLPRLIGPQCDNVEKCDLQQAKPTGISTVSGEDAFRRAVRIPESLSPPASNPANLLPSLSLCYSLLYSVMAILTTSHTYKNRVSL